MGFSNFPAATREFLKGIGAHSDKGWFEANRGLYEAGYVQAGKDFISTLGPRLAEVSPQVKFDPRVNGSITRVNRDIRFSKDKRPYKDHLDLWFWHGDSKSWDRPGFWFRLTAEKVMLGTGIHMFEKDQLERFRQSVIHPRSGKALVAAVEEVKAAGDYWIGEKTRKLMPKGYEADPSRAEYLLYEGLTAGIDLPAEAAYAPGFADMCLGHFRATWPIGRWLLAEVAE